MAVKDLKRQLGLWPALAIAVSTTIGSGIFVTTSQVASASGAYHATHHTDSYQSLL